MMAWALFCHDFDLSKGINILSEKCPVVLDHYIEWVFTLPFFDEVRLAVGWRRVKAAQSAPCKGYLDPVTHKARVHQIKDGRCCH